MSQVKSLFSTPLCPCCVCARWTIKRILHRIWPPSSNRRITRVNRNIYRALFQPRNPVFQFFYFFFVIIFYHIFPLFWGTGSNRDFAGPKPAVLPVTPPQKNHHAGNTRAQEYLLLFNGGRSETIELSSYRIGPQRIELASPMIEL